jgi:hypothetical protein
MPPGRPGLRWVAKIRASAAFCLAGAAAGTGLYFANLAYIRAHERLEITNVQVTAGNQSVACNGTADIIGTIFTNGRRGSVSYQWVLNGSADPLLAADVSGSSKVQVSLEWAFHGKGTGSAVAGLRVLNSQRVGSSITFAYSCPK